MQDLQIVQYEPMYFEQALNLDGRPSKRSAQKLKMLELTDIFYHYLAIINEDVFGFIIMENMGDKVSHYMVQKNVKEKRRGISNALVWHVFHEIGLGGHISLCVNTDNKGAIKFYEAMGFKRSGYTPNGIKRAKTNFGIKLIYYN